MKEYIDFNTEMKKHSKNDFERDFFKLTNNSVFGKTMENINNRKYIKLKSESKAEHFVKRPNFISRTIFDKDLIACHMKN